MNNNINDKEFDNLTREDIKSLTNELARLKKETRETEQLIEEFRDAALERENMDFLLNLRQRVSQLNGKYSKARIRRVLIKNINSELNKQEKGEKKNEK